MRNWPLILGPTFTRLADEQDLTEAAFAKLLHVLPPPPLAADIITECKRREAEFARLHRETAGRFTESPRRSAIESVYNDVIRGAFGA